jgi:hypothetical protein
VNPSAARIRLVIGLVALLVILGLLALKRTGVDDGLFRVLAIAGGLLVTLLFVTYRALLKLVEAARAGPHAPPSGDEDDT